MIELKPCPFCGGKADCSKDGISDMDGKPMWWVECPACGISTSGSYERQPEVDAWNSRTGKDVNVATNADRIRSMSDEELHKFLLDFEAGDVDYAKTFCDLCCKDAALEQRSTDCEGCLLWWLKNDATLPQGINWLQQPVKEEHNESD